jgi:hypothetical protein
MLQDLGVLTPSLVVCVAFLAGVFVLLRREMAPRRRDREANQPPADMSDGEISELEDDGLSATSDYEETADPQTGRRSRDYPR